jgi:hypothetical protein
MASIVNGALRIAPSGSAARANRPEAGGFTVFRQQLRSVAAAVWRQAVLGALLLACLSMLLLVHHARDPGRPSDLQFAEMAMIAVMAALAAPLAVWKGEEPARRGYFWALPVDRFRHTLMKVAAGWALLMAAVGAFLLWAALLAWTTGGELSLGDTRVYVPPRAGAAGYVTQAWPMASWMWIVPFVAASAAYLLGSIVVLSTSRPWLWPAGLLFLGMVLQLVDVSWAHGAANALVEGRYGMTVMVTGSGYEETVLVTAAGDRVRAGSFVPDAARWAIAALLWVGVALAGVVAAARRQQEQ